MFSSQKLKKEFSIYEYYIAKKSTLWERSNKDKIVLIDFFQNFIVLDSRVKDINYLVKFVVKINLWRF